MYFATIIKNGVDKVIIINEEKTKYCYLMDILDSDVVNLSSFIKSHSDKDISLIKNYLVNGHLYDFNESDFVFNAPIPYPIRNAFCLGKNYLDHLNEIKMLDGAKDGVLHDPIYFSKLAYPAIGTNSKVSSFSYLTKELDYETELTVVIGKTGRDIKKEEARDYIFGYTICNDFSVRDFQKKHSQWHKGKSFDGHLTMGPYIAYNDIIDYPPKLDIATYVNGEERQSANTDLFLFDLDYIISDLSKGLTLYAGDIILTGTCKGVGLGYNPPKYLKVGDEVISYIEKIGELKSTIVD